MNEGVRLRETARHKITLINHDASIRLCQQHHALRSDDNAEAHGRSRPRRHQTVGWARCPLRIPGKILTAVDVAIASARRSGRDHSVGR